MSLEPFLRRELITSVRRRVVFAERCGTVGLMAAVVAGLVFAWDWWEWDRSSVAGRRSFALATLGWVVAAEAVLIVGLMPALIAPAIASERDRKSLDALLGTPLPAGSIVLGTTVAGLLRFANGSVALGPILLLLIGLGGIDPRLILLCGAGLASTAVVVAALAAAITAGARSASEATSATVGVVLTWLSLPVFCVITLPRVWATGASWIKPACSLALASSPVGVALSLVGVIPRGTLVDGTLRMIALQTGATVVLMAWAIGRLRPASRAIYDQAGRAALLRRMQARWRRRPPCGNDPVLWREIHPARRGSPVMSLLDQWVRLVGVGLLVYATSWFAVPAFAELSRTGYGALVAKPVMPDVNPMARVLVTKLGKLSLSPPSGQARLEFNIVLRQATFAFFLLCSVLVVGYAAESLAKERERDTWLGLIATPLTGHEILRAKMLGSIWRIRSLIGLMSFLWLVGMLAGGLHPLGCLIAAVELVISSWFLAALGVSCSLWASTRSSAAMIAIVPAVLSLWLGILPFGVPGLASVLVGACTVPFQAWAALLSYEDVHAMTHHGLAPQFTVVGITSTAGAWLIFLVGTLSTICQWVGAWLLMRFAGRQFDAIVGRPIRNPDP